MANSLYRLPAGSRVLVTGANGFVGSNIIQCLLELGFKVRGVVRSPKPWLDEMFREKFGEDSFESVIVANFKDVDVLAGAMGGVSGLAHVASDVSFNSDPEKVITPVVKATHNVLEAAARYSEIQRVVLTSSSVAVLFPEADKEGVSVDEGEFLEQLDLMGSTWLMRSSDTWNEEAVRAAWDPNSSPQLKGLFCYAASKTEGEKAAWKWVEDNKPGFEFNTVLPEFSLGRILHPEIHGSTMGWVRGLLKGDTRVFQTYVPQYFVDVVDIARLHTAALLDPNTVSQRIFGFATPLNLTEMVAIVRKLRPDNTQIPDPPADGHDLTNVIPARKAEKLLRDFYGQPGWTTVENSIAVGLEGY
ncbi:hypothetical protein PENANT_c003G11043 [Penicillium antarcticum]|uniref:3-beta hydroxysteroid dehydrogenase/isomerase domain-containing protein n=1 Tax=Penicillium antarcticum TaxID=416450 RepID=A0A1V6QHW1_9EURO|nr:uncharacterized protein N7508_005979 [Penicillium antarcticum]KAJ5306964.1 hypothetical protein N7508_005979 [Penicillium antarcticum]OQD88811.1 hypothetical protein PENANT_c003G11043 [Penicillium antarcticum]